MAGGTFDPGPGRPAIVRPHLPHSDEHRRRQTTVVLVLLAIIALLVFMLFGRQLADSEKIGQPTPSQRLDSDTLSH